MTQEVPGDIMEFGIFKGCSFVRLCAFRDAFENLSKKIIGFDVFGAFPDNGLATDFDKQLRHKYADGFSQHSISRDQLIAVLRNKRIENTELIQGDIQETLPEFTRQNPEIKVSLIHMDVDIHGPSKVIIETLYQRLSKGGVLIFDNYDALKGEAKAVDEYFGKEKIQYLPFCKSPCYIVK
jgi:hypothetical protein